jgi:DNA modification methylase
MPDTQKAALHRSREHWGYVEPLVVRQGNEVVGGNQRLDEALTSNLKEVPVIRIHVNDVEAKALNLALNKIHGEWDEELLVPILAELKDLPEIDLTGFQPAEIEKLIREIMPQTEEDEIPEPPVEPIMKLGDIWQLDKHRILCGDSTKGENVQKLLGGTIPILMATDPPYGVSLDHTWRQDAGVGLQIWDSSPARTDTLLGDEGFDWIPALGLSNSPIVYVWHAGRYGPKTYAALESFGYEVKEQIIWLKTHFALSRQYYHWKHEPCWFAVKKGQTVPWYVGRDQTTVWEANSPTQIMGKHTEEKTMHPTQKPSILFEIPIRNHLKQGEVVYDPFLGSGTTLVAAEKLGRTCMGIEIEPKYCDVAVKRWENLTGRKAERVVT